MFLAFCRSHLQLQHCLAATDHRALWTSKKTVLRKSANPVIKVQRLKVLGRQVVWLSSEAEAQNITDNNYSFEILDAASDQVVAKVAQGDADVASIPKNL